MRAFACVLVFASAVVFSQRAIGQTTAFTYQGKLTDNGSPAAGNYQMEFKLFNAATGGTQLGSTLADIPVTVTAGVFSIQLDFGASPFTGASTWLEIGVEHNGGEGYSVLPREQITASPFAIRTLSAVSADVALDSQKLGGVAASQYVTAANIGTNAIRNQSALQAGASFNIGGNGTIAGSLALGTDMPTGKLSIASAPSWTADNWGAAIDLQNASAIAWTYSPYTNLRQGIGRTTTGLFFFRTDYDIGQPAPYPPLYDLTIANDGKVAIGPIGVSGNAQTARLDVVVPSGDAVSVSGYQPYLTFRDGSPGSYYPSYIQGIQGDLVLKSGGGNTVVVKDGKWTAANWNAAIALSNFSTIGWMPTPDGKAFGIGQQAGGLFVFSALEGPGSTHYTPNYLFEISEYGDVYQPRGQGGLAKAMVIVDKNGGIIRCFNGVTGSSSANCGFSVSKGDAYTFNVNMGFSVADRFALVNTDSPYYGAAVNYIANTLSVFVPYPGNINFFTLVLF